MADWLTTPSKRTLSQALGDDKPRVAPKRGEGFEAMLSRTFAEGAAANTAAKPSPVVRDEDDAAILTAAARYAGEQSNGRAAERNRHAERAARFAPAPEKPQGSFDDRLRAWAEGLTPEQREAVPFSDSYLKLPEQSRSKLDAALAAFSPKPETPSAEEREAFESELLEESDEEEFVYEV